MHELAELGEVLAHQREVVLVVELADPQDPVAAVAVAEPAAERVAGVGRVGDQRVVAQQLDDLLEQPRLRVVRVDVEVAGHAGPAQACAAPRRAGRGAAPGGSAKISDSSAVCTAWASG